MILHQTKLKGLFSGRVISKKPRLFSSTKPEISDAFGETFDPFQIKNASLSSQPEFIPISKGCLPPASGVSVKKLGSGFTFVAINEPVPITTMSLFVKAGSRFEDDRSVGASHFLKRLAFRSTEKKYYYPLIRDMDVLGSELGSLNTREHVGYFITGMRSEMKSMAQTLGAIWEPRLEEWEVERVRQEVKDESNLAQSNPKQILFDLVHYEAFRDQGLANSTFAPLYSVDQIDPLILRKYVNTHYAPSRITIVGNGASMEDLQSMVEYFEPFDIRGLIEKSVNHFREDFFSVLMKPGTIYDAKQTYVGGGEVRVPGSGSTQIVVASEGIGANKDIASQISASIIQNVLGGGSSSLRGIIPGLGRQSRLGRDAFHAGGWIREIFAFNFSYSDSGLFGIYANASTGNVKSICDIIGNQIRSLENIKDEEIARARAQLKSSFLSRMYSDRLAAAEFYTSQVNNTGSAMTPIEYASEIDKVDTKTILETAKQIASSKLTVAAFGDIKGLPKF
ncbi:mitochondrial-processing peptidase subunit alpha-2-like [Schistocerca gregaria]|uniref:mitochondrial-processing peptidase subunit alpha-2-like n=1 Tax=Schistocerca gregaria TaxID=7010 RepID=UPI00211E73A8|nr:mitochondrial-processing peptidase subunit alpha-2-like [Schistocerca gregaria]